MMPPSFEDTRLFPLVTDDAIQERVSELIGRANIRQLWLLFLDGDGVQLPLLIPVDGLPSEPTSEETESVVVNLRDLMQAISAASVVMVWERYGPAQLTPQDAAWACSLHAACAIGGVQLRAMLLSYRSGVRWITEDDYCPVSDRAND